MIIASGNSLGDSWEKSDRKLDKCGGLGCFVM